MIRLLTIAFLLGWVCSAARGQPLAAWQGPQSPDLVRGSAMAYDTVRQRALLFGGVHNYEGSSSPYFNTLLV